MKYLIVLVVLVGLNSVIYAGYGDTVVSRVGCSGVGRVILPVGVRIRARRHARVVARVTKALAATAYVTAAYRAPTVSTIQTTYPMFPSHTASADCSGRASAAVVLRPRFFSRFRRS